MRRYLSHSLCLMIIKIDRLGLPSCNRLTPAAPRDYVSTARADTQGADPRIRFAIGLQLFQNIVAAIPIVAIFLLLHHRFPANIKLTNRLSNPELYSNMSSGEN